MLLKRAHIEEKVEKAKYAAHFDANGNAVLTGTGARSNKRSFDTMMA